MSCAYYNETDPYCVKWLRNLISAGLIAPGDVDERSIEDVRPNDIRGYTQCHFFAGIGVWSYALRLAGWSDDRPVWTGSCPCQPFSTAGKGAGFADERHLWPAFYHLIGERRPAVVLGEQVASKDADPWIDLVHTDLEALDYAFGAVPFPSAGIGAPHIRDRLYWVADAGDRRDLVPSRDVLRLADADGIVSGQGGAHLRGRADGGDAQPWTGLGGGGVPSRMDDADNTRLEGLGLGYQTEDGRLATARSIAPASEFGGLAHAESGRWQGQPVRAGAGLQANGVAEDGFIGRAGPTNGFWRDADWLACRDGRWRPVEPGTFPLAHGAPARVGRLRAYGNAINAEAAKAFIESVMECIA